jgi:hypothetical protein
MKTKTELLLATLKERPNDWIDLPYLAAVTSTFDVGTRAARLRGQGYNIENKIENDGRTRHSYYRLVVEPGQGQLPFPRSPGTVAIEAIRALNEAI